MGGGGERGAGAGSGHRYGESWDQLTIAIGTAVRRYSTENVPLTPRPVLPLRP